MKKVNLDNMIAGIRAKKKNSRYDKVTKINKPLLHLNKKIDVYVNVDMKKIIKTITDKDKIPTVEQLRERMIQGVNMIFEEHSYTFGVMNHNCCFEKYKKDIISLIKIILNSNYIYAHRFDLKNYEEVNKNGK